jgi:hypothetical protein
VLNLRYEGATVKLGAKMEKLVTIKVETAPFNWVAAAIYPVGENRPRGVTMDNNTGLGFVAAPVGVECPTVVVLQPPAGDKISVSILLGDTPLAPKRTRTAGGGREQFDMTFTIQVGGE